MAFAIRNLSVLAYANGFTLWHYKAGKDRLEQVLLTATSLTSSARRPARVQAAAIRRLTSARRSPNDVEGSVTGSRALFIDQ